MQDYEYDYGCEDEDKEKNVMKYRQLGNSGIQVSAVCMGCWAIVGDSLWGPQDHDEAIAAIRKAVEVGINFFDTAEAYGRGSSESLLAQALGNQCKDIVIASKVGSDNLTHNGVIQACEQSLKRLGRETIDLYQIHWPSFKAPVEEAAKAMLELKEQGKVRAIGVSNFGKKDLSDFLAHAPIVTNQVAYNLLWRAVEFDVVPKCVQNKIGILSYSSLMQGLLTGKFATADDVPPGRARTRHFSKDRELTRHGEDGCEAKTFVTLQAIRSICGRLGKPMAHVALAWLLAQDHVTAVIAGARNPQQMLENAAAADVELPCQVITELTQATDHLKQVLGPNPDMWQSESRMH